MLNLVTSYKNPEKRNKIFEHFELIPIGLEPLVDEAYERGYNTLVKLNNGNFGFVYDDCAELRNSELEECCKKIRLFPEKGFGGILRTLDKVEFNPLTCFLMFEKIEHLEVFIKQFRYNVINIPIKKI